jgi:hypothetical protein
MGAEEVFCDAGPLLEPTKKTLAGGPCEGAAQDGLTNAGGLADEDDAAEDGPAGDGGRVHLWTKTAGKEFGDVGLQEMLAGGTRGHGGKWVLYS